MIRNEGVTEKADMWAVSIIINSVRDNHILDDVWIGSDKGEKQY